MRECDSVALELPALITGELDESASAQLENHLVTCSDCRRELVELRRLVGLVARAPLEHRPPAHLERDVFTFLELDPVAEAVRTAPLEHQPPTGLERKSMEHAGVVSPGPTRWQRASAYLAPALAACLLIVGFLAWSGDEDSSDEGPVGETIVELHFAPPTPDSAWTPLEGAILERPDGTYVVNIEFEDYPEVSGDENCRLDLVAADGTHTTVTRFQVSEENTDWWPVTWPLPGDPLDYESLEMFLEDRSTGDERSILEAPIEA